MRAVGLIAIAVLVLSCRREGPCSEPAPPAAASRGDRKAVAAAPGGSGTDARPTPTGPVPSVRVAYAEPKNPAHRSLYDGVRKRRVLEQAAEAASAVRLPKQLLLEFRGCDGDSNAYYNEKTTSVTFCYEYLADLKKTAVQHLVDGKYVQFPGSDQRIPLEDAIDGPVCFVLFHEMGHAVYHLLEVPVLGRQEDAADDFAAAMLLRLGKEMAMSHLRGAAWAYAVGAMSMVPDLSDFADIHSLDEQRYINILCLAYGSDPDFFGPAVKRGLLPAERARECGWEYRQVRYALQRLVLPYVDEERLEYVRMKHLGGRGSSSSRRSR